LGPGGKLRKIRTNETRLAPAIHFRHWPVSGLSISSPNFLFLPEPITKYARVLDLPGRPARRVAKRNSVWTSTEALKYFMPNT
jgi:hypothetical protein